MDGRPTLEMQILAQKEEDRRIYGERVLRAMRGERTYELNQLLSEAPLFLRRSAIDLYVKIAGDYENGKPTTPGEVRRVEKVVEFAYLAFLNLIEVQEQPYLKIFKKRIIIPKERISLIGGL